MFMLNREITFFFTLTSYLNRLKKAHITFVFFDLSCGVLPVVIKKLKKKKLISEVQTFATSHSAHCTNPKEKDKRKQSQTCKQTKVTKK